MGITERKQRHRQGVREGILRAAREIAAESGWPAVTMRKIAGRIEYSPPVIYEHFASKDDILLALMRQGYAEQLQAVRAAATTAVEPEDALLAIGRSWLGFAFDAPDLYQVMYGLGGAPFSPAETRKEGEKIAEVVGEEVAAILRRHGEPADVMGKVTMLWATLHGLAALTMVGRIPRGQAERLAVEAGRTSIAAWASGPEP